MQRTLIWDIPTRIFHWTMVLSFAGAWLTHESDQWLGVHVFLGYLMLGMVVFRLIWGVVGTHYARFTSFWYGPLDAMAYLKQVAKASAPRHIGHNPTGSVAIYLLLVLTVVVGGSGFFTLGTEEQQGITAGWLSITQGRALKKLHEASAMIMLLLVIGHISGVVIESILHKENLARSMVTGIKMAEPGTMAVAPKVGTSIMMLVTILGFAGWWFFYAIHTPVEKKLEQLGVSAEKLATIPKVPFVGKKLPDNAQWREECGSCHVAFYPSLLPSRSWQRVAAEQDKHFGTDLGLDPVVMKSILEFMNANAAEKHLTEAGVKIDRSLKPDATPVRITETPYWLKKHKEVADSVWKSPQVKSKANCDACHLDAQEGTYEDAAMRLPK